MGWKIVLADPSPVMRRWQRLAVAPIGGQVFEVDDGLELLSVVAEHGPFDLIVCNRSLTSITGDHVLTMMRTAGDITPFLLIAPFCRRSVRSLISKLGNASVLDDPLDGAELLRMAKSLIAECHMAA